MKYVQYFFKGKIVILFKLWAVTSSLNSSRVGDTVSTKRQSYDLESVSQSRNNHHMT